MKVRINFRGIIKKFAGVVLILIAACVASRLFGTDLTELLGIRIKDPSDDELEIHFIDVGQGDSVLIRTSESSILVDAGTDESQYKLSAYLSSFGIERIDCFVFTHPHADHIGGARRVLEDFEVGAVMMCASDSSSRYLKNALEIIDEKGIKLTMPIRGDVYGVGDLKLRILAPAPDADTSGNNGSIVMRVEWGETSFLLTGDAEIDSEKDILAAFSADMLKSDILKVGHHGSYTSTSDEFLDAVNPEWAVISCGKDNQYSHPHSEVIARLNAHGITDDRILRTDKLGDIVFVSDGKKVLLFGKYDLPQNESAA